MPRIALIRPPADLVEHSASPFAPEGVLPPSDIASLAALIRTWGYRVWIFDALAQGLEREELLFLLGEYRIDMAVVTATTATVYAAANLGTSLLRTNPMPVFLVGGHITAAPKETLARFDCFTAALAGDAEPGLPALLEAVGTGLPLDKVPGGVWRAEAGIAVNPLQSPDFDRLPFPAWDIYPDFPRSLRAYPLPPFSPLTRSALPLATLRGCRRAIPGSLDGERAGELRGFGAEYLVEWTRSLHLHYGIREFAFTDPDFLAIPGRCEAWCEELLRQPWRYSWSFRTRPGNVSLESLALFRKAGCGQVTLEIFSGSQEMLERMEAGFSLDDAAQAVEGARKAGLRVRGHWVLGAPGETPETLEATRRFLRKFRLDGIELPFFLPGVSKETTAQLAGKGNLDPDWNRRFTIRPSFVPEGLSVVKLLAAQNRMYAEFYRRIGTVGRLAAGNLACPGRLGLLAVNHALAWKEAVRSKWRV